MIIKRKSVYSGVVRSRNIDVNPRDYEMWKKVTCLCLMLWAI